MGSSLDQIFGSENLVYSKTYSESENWISCLFFKIKLTAKNRITKVKTWTILTWKNKKQIIRKTFQRENFGLNFERTQPNKARKKQSVKSRQIIRKNFWDPITSSPKNFPRLYNFSALRLKILVGVFFQVFGLQKFFKNFLKIFLLWNYFEVLSELGIFLDISLTFF